VSESQPLESTAANGSQQDRTVVVTGATSGIGRAAALQLAAGGYPLLLVGRDQQRGDTLLAELARVQKQPAVFIAGDLSTAAGVDRVAERIHQHARAVQVLVNGAGILSPSRTVTDEGFELNFAVHHLAPYSMTSRLLGLLREGGGRVVNINSEGHRAALSGGGPVYLDFTDLQNERRYEPFMAYSRSKLANLLFTHELHRRHPELTVVALHPGMARTNIGRSLPRLQVLLFSAVSLTARQGARPVVRLATSPDVANGGYYNRFTRATPSPAACDPAAAARLWALTEELRGPFGS
jgi:NAD(P)-dependent dehydrogenase (short-subunit alcohol dehydrogenase family)